MRIRFILSMSICQLVLLLMASCGQKAHVDVRDLCVNSLYTPLAIEDSVPTLSWKLQCEANDVRQTGYHLLVASSPDLLAAGTGDLWDSGEVASDQSLYVPYKGVSLASRQHCYWKVKVQTNRGASDWSAPAMWGMALLEDTDWQAQWIGHTAMPSDSLVGATRVPARYLRRQFDLPNKDLKRASLYICGLGLYEAYLNGQRISDQQLAPTPTGYNVDVKYNVFDVTDLLADGEENVVGVVLGNGRYTSMRQPGGKQMSIPMVTHYDMPKLLLQLEVDYADGTRTIVCSDKEWKITTDGPIRSNNEFDGEYYDARLEHEGWNATGYNDIAWMPVEIVNAPEGKLSAQQNPNIKVMDRLTPISITPHGNTYILDMGQNMVGWLQLNIRGAQQGDVVKMRFAETLNSDGSLYVANLRSAQATDTYVAGKESDVVWHPTFVYHGFRYVEVSGLRTEPALADFEGQVLYDEMQPTGTLITSNALLDSITNNALWGIKGNYRGMPTDCPQRDERMGWFGDRTTGCYGESYLLNNHSLYAKWLDDIEESMQSDGSLPDVAPAYWSVYTDNITWPAVFITAADMLYQRYGDIDPIRKHYLAMKRWLAHMKEKYGQEGLITKDTYGDWCMPPEQPELIHSQDPSRITEGTLLSSAFYYHLCNLMQQFAQLQGIDEDVAYFAAEMTATEQAFNTAYLDAEEHIYANGTVTANLLPLRFGMVPDDQKQEIFNSIVRTTMTDFDGHVSTGVVGIQQLMRGLTDYGRGDLALQIATNTTYPSWGYMLRNGATTIWELWNGNTADPAMNSGNHVMLLGDLLVWEYSYLAGIDNAPGSAGFKQVLLRPRPVKGLDHVTATYESPYGTIKSSWQKQQDLFAWQFTIPCNTTGLVCVPCGVGGLDEASRRTIINYGGHPAPDVLTDDTGYNHFEAFIFPSGSYEIEVNYVE